MKSARVAIVFVIIVLATISSASAVDVTLNTGSEPIRLNDLGGNGVGLPFWNNESISKDREFIAPKSGLIVFHEGSVKSYNLKGKKIAEREWPFDTIPSNLYIDATGKKVCAELSRDNVIILILMDISLKSMSIFSVGVESDLKARHIESPFLDSSNGIIGLAIGFMDRSGGSDGPGSIYSGVICWHLDEPQKPIIYVNENMNAEGTLFFAEKKGPYTLLLTPMERLSEVDYQKSDVYKSLKFFPMANGGLAWWFKGMDILKWYTLDMQNDGKPHLVAASQPYLPNDNITISLNTNKKNELEVSWRGWGEEGKQSIPLGSSGYDCVKNKSSIKDVSISPIRSSQKIAEIRDNGFEGDDPAGHGLDIGISRQYPGDYLWVKSLVEDEMYQHVWVKILYLADGSIDSNGPNARFLYDGVNAFLNSPVCIKRSGNWIDIYNSESDDKYNYLFRGKLLRKSTIHRLFINASVDTIFAINGDGIVDEYTLSVENGIAWKASFNLFSPLTSYSENEFGHDFSKGTVIFKTDTVCLLNVDKVYLRELKRTGTPLTTLSKGINLRVLDRDNELDTIVIDGTVFNDFWYKVNVGSITGWIFGAFLSEF